jgi:hypothetical protein
MNEKLPGLLSRSCCVAQILLSAGAISPRDTPPRTFESWNNLIQLYEAWDKPEKAEQWRAELPVEEDTEK